jgi:hypothetical protein
MTFVHICHIVKIKNQHIHNQQSFEKKINV